MIGQDSKERKEKEDSVDSNHGQKNTHNTL